ncbi:MAG: hypothetical protein KAG64_04265 [Bacteroidales bacterium]|nr:hypothetical protein [Bacteroidales bacterium]
MKKLSLWVLLISITMATGCKKDEVKEDENDSTPYQSKGYIPLKVGSYWIYQTYKTLPNGTDTATSIVDSTYISGTIVINSKTYYISEKSGVGKSTVYVRDSIGYLVDTLGGIIMSEVNFTDTINSSTEWHPNTGDPMYHIARIMYNEHKQISVPAGVFSDCIEARDKVNLYFAAAAPPNSFYYHNYYAKDIGLIEYQYRYSSSATMFKVKLIRFYIP